MKTKRLILLAALLMTCCAAHAADGCAGGTLNRFYISTSGADSNAGTSTGAAWKFAPDMPAASGTSKAHTPIAGDCFIFRLGDKWDYGNSLSTNYIGSNNQATCGLPAYFASCGWMITHDGTSSNPITYTTDPAWTAGGGAKSFTLDGNNPASGSVAACTYDQSSYAAVILTSNLSHLVLDSLHATGQCWHGNQQSPNGTGGNVCCSIVIFNSTDGNTSNSYGLKITNFTADGWSHKTFSCTSPGGTPTGDCDGLIVLAGLWKGSIADHIIVNPTNTDGKSGCVFCFGASTVTNFDLGHVSNAIVSSNTFHELGFGVFHDICQSGDGVTHGNGFEANNEAAGTNYYHDVVFRNNYQSGCGTGIVFLTAPNVTNTSCNVWNVLTYNNGGAQVGFNGNTTGTDVVCNSTFEMSGGSLNFNSSAMKNTLVINASGGGAINVGTAVTNSTMTSVQATAAGFTSGSTYPYQPTSSTCNGNASPTCPVGNGTDLSASWAAGFTTVDSGLGVTLNADSTLTSPARTQLTRSAPWTIGAMNLPGTSAPTINTFTRAGDICSGATTSLAWTTSNADSITIVGLGTFGPNTSTSISPTRTTTYSITATGTGGTSPPSTVTVGVGCSLKGQVSVGVRH